MNRLALLSVSILLLAGVAEASLGVHLSGTVREGSASRNIADYVPASFLEGTGPDVAVFEIERSAAQAHDGSARVVLTLDVEATTRNASPGCGGAYARLGYDVVVEFVENTRVVEVATVKDASSASYRETDAAIEYSTHVRTSSDGCLASASGTDQNRVVASVETRHYDDGRVEDRTSGFRSGGAGMGFVASDTGSEVLQSRFVRTHQPFGEEHRVEFTMELGHPGGDEFEAGQSVYLDLGAVMDGPILDGDIEREITASDVWLRLTLTRRASETAPVSETTATWSSVKARFGAAR